VQSYAGKYIPALASRIHRGRPQPDIYLRGIAIGDGWSDPPVVSCLNLVTLMLARYIVFVFFVCRACSHELDGSTSSCCNELICMFFLFIFIFYFFQDE